jgi:hypothetical protein
MTFLLKWKIWRIESAIRALIKAEGLKPIVWSFGAYYIGPKHMVFVVGVPIDEDKNKLKDNARFIQPVKSLLVKFGWPEKAREHVAFDIESQETVERENNGNWWYHYK